MDETKILTILYDAPLAIANVTKFRGAIINALGRDETQLHNHGDGSSVNYRYPSVQYKTIDGKAAIVAINEGIDAVASLLEHARLDLRIGREQVSFRMTSATTKLYQPQLVEDAQFYHLTNYVPLNSENYATYRNFIALTDKINFIEDILVGNMISFFKGINYHCEQQIQCAITEFAPLAQNVVSKGVEFSAFDISFVCNALLPEHVGLGKSVAKGHGVLSKIS